MKTKKIRLEGAIANAKMNGIRIKKSEIGALLWPESSEGARRLSLSKILNGGTKRLEFDWVKKICVVTGCDPNYLFGYDEWKEEIELERQLAELRQEKLQWAVRGNTEEQVQVDRRIMMIKDRLDAIREE